ncbi:uncharacterized protein EDB91DRAFT_1350209 [Suillus paluster]|uniref:uncharacterized protein n=1 Tax=Suillus paluster TaxID=48578 RepID=UPI001B864F8F|nr:uncharacterized protein EDB91DRAFT_1350209 [Suillus paluster]KAG1728065.1 hypothetical protein EDB91DRAFT_1350209 [Suillus paluster]
MPSESSPRVCYGYAQTGSCRFGSQCKFAHVEGVNNNNNRKRRTRHKRPQTRTQTPLDQFFAKYPQFEYDSSESASLEFYRMCDEFDWDRDDEEREEASRYFKDAIVHQFNHIYGTDADNLTSWHTLCQIVQVSPVPDTLESCREAVKATYVNIVDLIDTGVTEGAVTVFVSEVELSEYTKRTGKIFPRDNVHAGGLLKYLLRRIMNPRPERVSGRKTQSRRKR